MKLRTIALALSSLVLSAGTVTAFPSSGNHVPDEYVYYCSGRMRVNLETLGKPDVRYVDFMTRPQQDIMSCVHHKLYNDYGTHKMKFVTFVDEANVRTGASTNSSIVMVLDKYTIINVYSSVGEWYWTDFGYIHFTNVVGYGGQ